MGFLLIHLTFFLFPGIYKNSDTKLRHKTKIKTENNERYYLAKARYSAFVICGWTDTAFVL